MKDTKDDNALLIPEIDVVAKAFDSEESLEAILTAIETECRAEHYTAETRQGRDRIKSQAYKIARSKTAMDNVGKGLTEEANELIKRINGRRRIVTTRLDALKDEIRKPLTEWEEQDDKRKEAIKARIKDLFGLRPLNGESAELRALQDATIAVELDESWQEFLEEATKAKDNFLRHLAAKIHEAEMAERREEELARLRAAEEQRKRDDEARAAAEREAAEARALADAEIARLKAELEAMKQRPMPAPVGIVGTEVTHVISDEVTADKSEVSAVDTTTNAVEKIDMPANGDNFVRDSRFSIRTLIAGSILRLIEDCEDHDSAADTIAAAIVNGEIPNVVVIR